MHVRVADSTCFLGRIDERHAKRSSLQTRSWMKSVRPAMWGTELGPYGYLPFEIPNCGTNWNGAG